MRAANLGQTLPPFELPGAWLKGLVVIEPTDQEHEAAMMLEWLKLDTELRPLLARKQAEPS